MMIAERNNTGRHYVNTRLNLAKQMCAEDFPEFTANSPVSKLLSELIEVSSKGFRGVVITALTGLYLDEHYDPLNNFYACNPRSIFECGIWYALQDNGIPCGKSDPLNVAKNTNLLNENWAQGKRPQSAAMAVVDFLRLVTNSNQEEKNRLIDYFFYRLWIYSQSITNYKITEIDTSQTSRLAIGSMLIEFTLTYPESGVLPQYFIAQLLSTLFTTSDIKVIGGDESVFGTNTTSKKPADIWFEIGGTQTNLYEVTVKPVSKKRLDDSIDALHSTGHLNHSVTFICRMESDVKDLDVVNGCYSYRGKLFNFIDYRNFSLSLCALLSDDKFTQVMDNLSSLVKGKNISMKTKSGWNTFFS